jgi:hypothetical protein
MELCTRSKEPEPCKAESHHFPTLILTPICLFILISMYNSINLALPHHPTTLILFHITTELRLPLSVPCELLPVVTNSSSSSTSRRNSISVIWVCFPSDASVTSNIDILVLDHSASRKTDRSSPQMIT